MEQKKIPFIDRLRDRGFIDQWGFALFAAVGSAFILLAKWLGAQGGWVAFGAIVFMLIYAFIVGRAGTGRVRADQAGDNCYYLGLIYTLASLSYAIATFDPDNSATTIVQGFGVALATTIVGLVLRVFFNQGRPDLENIEEQARLDLTEATSKLRSQLSLAAESVNDYVRQVRQSLDEMSEATRKDVANTVEASIERVQVVAEKVATGIQDVFEASSQTIRAEANDFAMRSKKYTTTFDDLLAKLDGHAEGLERITKSHNTLATVAESSSQVAQQVLEAVGKLNEGASIAHGIVQSIRDGGVLASERMEQLQQMVERIEKSVMAYQEEAARQLAELKAIPDAAVHDSIKLISGAASAFAAEIAEVAMIHKQAANSAVNQAKEIFEGTQQNYERFNEQLKQSQKTIAKSEASISESVVRLAKRVDEMGVPVPWLSRLGILSRRAEKGE